MKEIGFIAFRTTREEAKVIDRLADEDGYMTRSAWIRHLIRNELKNRGITNLVTSGKSVVINLKGDE